MTKLKTAKVSKIKKKLDKVAGKVADVIIMDEIFSPKVKKKQKSSASLNENTNISVLNNYYKMVDDLLLELNKNKKLRFWKSNPFGDLMGLVPIERFYEKERGGKFFPFIDKIVDNCMKVVVINIKKNSDQNNIDKDCIVKKELYEPLGIYYIQNDDINKIVEEVLTIE